MEKGGYPMKRILIIVAVLFTLLSGCANIEMPVSNKIDLRKPV